MAYYTVISFQVIMDGLNNRVGTTGRTTTSPHFNADLIVGDLRNYYHKTYPRCKSLRICILEMAAVSAEEYLDAEKMFTEIK
jgi:hypothetical protein